jgi:hypothetical protein
LFVVVCVFHFSTAVLAAAFDFCVRFSVLLHSGAAVLSIALIRVGTNASKRCVTSVASLRLSSCAACHVHVRVALHHRAWDTHPAMLLSFV